MADSSVRISKEAMDVLENEKAKKRKKTGAKVYLRDLAEKAIKGFYKGK